MSKAEHYKGSGRKVDMVSASSLKEMQQKTYFLIIHNFSSKYSHRNLFPSFYAASPIVFIFSFLCNPDLLFLLEVQS